MKGESARVLPVMIGVVLPLAAALALGLAPRQQDLESALQRRETAQNPDEIAGILSQILAVEPWRYDLWEPLGRAEQDRGNLEASAAAYQRAADLNNLSVDGQHRLAEVYLALGETDPALQVWQGMIARGEADRSIFLRTAAALRSEGQISGAAAVLQNWLDVSPDDADVQYHLGLLLASDDPEGALDNLEAANRSGQASIPSVDRLISVLKSVLFEADPAFQQVLVGRALANHGDWDLSVRAFERAVYHRPEYAEAWALLSEARYQHDGGGEAALAQANALDPDSVVVRALTALQLRRQGNTEQALEALQAVAAAEPDEAIWQVEIGSTLADLGDLQAAQTHFSQAVAMDPDNAMMYYYQAWFCLANHVDVREVALPAARQALLLAPSDARMADLMGWVMLELDDTASAERFFLDATALDSMLNVAYLHLGQLYALQGDLDLARQNLERAVDLSVEGEPVFMLAERLLASIGEQ